MSQTSTKEPKATSVTKPSKPAEQQPPEEQPEIQRSTLDFSDLSIHEEIIQIGKHEYVLREASGDVACKYRNAMLERTQLGPDGKPVSVKGMADVEPMLVAWCLRRYYKGVEQPLKEDTVRAWPSRVLKPLFERIKEVSDLGEPADETVEGLEKKLEEAKAEQVAKEAAGKNLEPSMEDGSE